ncbi:MAG TPA: ATP-binding protein [Ferruginibacter sp.]|nr:ATP-binding protein [Ferruginibacter sp.]
MKKRLLSFLICIGCIQGLGQSKSSVQVAAQCDSILRLLLSEKDAIKKADLNLAFYSASIDGFPLQLISLSQKLLDASKKNNDRFLESAGLSAAAQGYRLTGNYVKALEYHSNAVALAEATGNKVLTGFAINQLGHIYKDRYQNEKALSVYKESQQYFKAAGREDIWYPEMNQGVVFYNMGNYDSALYYTTKVINNIGKVQNNSNLAVIYSTLGGLYSQKGNIDSVKKYFNLALDHANKVKSARYLSTTYWAIAEHFKQNKQFDSSASYFKKAVDIVAGSEMNNLVLNPAKELTSYYQNINADSAVKYWKVYSAANDSVNSIRINQQIQMLTFEDEQRKKDIEHAKTAYQNKLRTGILIGGLSAILLIALLLYRNNLQKQTTNKALQKTLADLKSTQAQLIQSEKMASLGELTAGIAHEIQNPLNFVNNFSEINKELLQELNEAIINADTEEAKSLITDLINNEQKINQHGKRADSIVKGMLQHSRKSTGQKVPVDINAVCDECLRLSYHGMRAKDKSFNATFETHFYEALPKINILQQEIGRVIINLCSNAFYEVNKKRKTAGNNYQPMVSITTSLWGNQGIEIKIHDNGLGIPQSIIDKIFQPFFTTKPTGEGTGLGLSMSYDIITKSHNGKLQVTSQENTGTSFTINLPFQNA